MYLSDKVLITFDSNKIKFDMPEFIYPYQKRAGVLQAHRNHSCTFIPMQFIKYPVQLFSVLIHYIFIQINWWSHILFQKGFVFITIHSI